MTSSILVTQNRRAKEKRLKEAEIEKLRINSRSLGLPPTMPPAVLPGLVGLVKMDPTGALTAHTNFLKHFSLLNAGAMATFPSGKLLSRDD